MISVYGDYVIDVDDMNYTVKLDRHKTVTDKNGNTTDVYDTKGYYNTLKSALRGVRDMVVSDKLSQEDMSLNQAVKTVVEVNQKFEDIMLKALGEV